MQPYFLSLHLACYKNVAYDNLLLLLNENAKEINIYIPRIFARFSVDGAFRCF